MHIAAGMPDPFQVVQPRLKYVLIRTKWDQAAKVGGSRKKLPVMPVILRLRDSECGRGQQF